MYCICSNKSLDDVVFAQKTNALPFEQVIDQYTSCNGGCTPEQVCLRLIGYAENDA
jgi:hypothetical protein